MDLGKVSPFQLVIGGAILTLAISDNRDIDDLNVLGNFVVSVGSLVLTAAAQKELLKSRAEENANKVIG